MVTVGILGSIGDPPTPKIPYVIHKLGCTQRMESIIVDMKRIMEPWGRKAEIMERSDIAIVPTRTKLAGVGYFGALRLLWSYRELIFRFIQRDVSSRYRESFLGIVWSFVTPVLMLGIYTFVFGVIFKSRWAQFTSSKAEFPMILFCGLTTYGIFADTITRAPHLIVGNVNYVKKVVFPLSIFPIISLGSSLVNAVISYSILIVGLSVFSDILQWTSLLLPLVLLPLLLLSLGLSWFFASLGVFIRDIGQILGITVQALLYLSPVFYPISSVPPSIRFLIEMNPLGGVIDNVRNVMIWGTMPNWNIFILWTIIGLIVSVFGYRWFERTRTGFADVL